MADLATEVPSLEAKLAGDAVYRGIWSAPRADLDLMLTHLSALVAQGGATKEIASRSDAKALKPSVTTLFFIFARVGHFPDDFTKKLREHLASTHDEPHLGVWSPWKKGDAPRDYSAIAAWLVPRDPAYLREHIAAKGAGPDRWTVPRTQKVARPWLVYAPEALERLALLTDLVESDCEPAGMEFHEAIDGRTGASRGECEPAKPRGMNTDHARLLVAGDFGKAWSTKPHRIEGDWPFSVDFGWVECIPVPVKGLDKNLDAVVFRTSTTTFALNGHAESHKLGEDVGPIWLPSATTPALKVNLGPVSAVGLKLCAEETTAESTVRLKADYVAAPSEAMLTTATSYVAAGDKAGFAAYVEHTPGVFITTAGVRVTVIDAGVAQSKVRRIGTTPPQEFWVPNEAIEVQ